MTRSAPQHRHRARASRRGHAYAVLLAATASALVVGSAGPAAAAPNDGVFTFDDGTVLDQSIEDYCQEFFDEFHSGGCEVSYEETAGEFRPGEPARVSRDGTTCPGASVNRVTVTDTRTFTRTLGFSVGLGEDRKFGEKAANTAKLAGQFNYSVATSEGSTAGFSGAVEPGNIGFVEFTPKLWYSVGRMAYTDQFDDTVTTEVDGLTPAKVGEFADGTYAVDQRPMTPDELARFCG